MVGVNILLQTAGLAIMVVIFIFYYIDRKYAVRSNRYFLYLAMSIYLSLVLDIFSIVTINCPDYFSMFVTKLVAKSYLVTVVLVVGLALVYVLNDIKYVHKKLYYTFGYSDLAVFAICTILIYSLPINVIPDLNGLNDHTEGLPIIITYVGTFIIMGLTIFSVFKYKQQIYEKRVTGVAIFISLWVFGSAVQGFFNYVVPQWGVVILSVSLSEALGSLVIYIRLENPSLNVDKVTGALNIRALKEYVDDAIRKGENKQILLINYDNEMSKAVLDYNTFPKVFAKALAEYKIKVFKSDKNDFIVALDYPLSEINLYVDKFKEKFYKKNDSITEIPVKVISFDDLSCFTDANDFMDVMDYVNTNQTIDKYVIEVSKDKVAKIHEKFLIKQKCDLALASKKVVVHYQPIYSTIHNKFTAAEALVRLIDDQGKLIYPGDFIEDMERDGKIVELGQIVFETVCEFVSKHNMEELGLDYIEVNLSTIQCMQENLAENYIDTVKKFNVDPKYINLEITETGQTAKQLLLSNMQKLKQFEFSFSLDDFGTGNSNLNYIVEMPVEIVKFDKTMVNSYFNNEIASYVMNSAISMIKGLGHKIVFEGIETKEQVEVAKNINIEYIQGYYYSKPVDQESFLKFIKEHNK